LLNSCFPFISIIQKEIPESFIRRQTMNQKTAGKALCLAGIYNIAGVLFSSLFFTNPLPAKYYPVVFSDLGMIVILLWGLAYLSVSSSYMHTGKLMIVFAVEKFVYSISWILFLTDKGYMLPRIFSESFVTGLMLSIYGVGDIIFGILFFRIWIINIQTGPDFFERFFGLSDFENHKFLE